MNTAVPGPGGARTPGEFVEQLRRLKAWSGLSFRDLEKQARALGDSLPASTIAGALKRDSLPHLDLVAALVRACGVTPEQIEVWIDTRRALAQDEKPEAAAVPCLLPADRPRFVGRVSELAATCRALRDPEIRPATVLVTGPAGIGKTTFVIRAGHAMTADFPDGQLYFDLNGFGDDPADPAGVLATFLRALGVHGANLPSDMTGRVHLYRSLLATKRVLVVLDNATDARQVRDLLPSGHGCAAIVASRASLAGIDGVRQPLAMLTTAEALKLLSTMVGEPRTAAEPEHAEAIIEGCGRLPLAVWVAGARLAARPHWTLSAMASALADEYRKLDELAVGDMAVRASVELSYRGLTARARQALRLLGLISAPDVAPWALAALLDTPVAQAERLFDDLLEVHLVEAAGSRYRLHDLVRVFARERGVREDDPAQRAEALARMLGAALQLTESAAARLNTDFQGITRHTRPHWTLPAGEVDRLLADPLSWLDSERQFLISTVERGLESPSGDLAAGLATAMTTFFEVRSHFDDWRRLHGKALSAMLAAGDRRSASKLRRGLGELATIQDYYSDAVVHFEAALKDIGTEEPEYAASSMAGLAYVYRLLGQYECALTYFHRAADLARATDNLNCLIYVTSGIGVAEMEMGQTLVAQQRFAESLRLSRNHGFRAGEARALACLGHSHRALGKYSIAAQCFSMAEEISTALGDRLTATHARCWLGTVRVEEGHHAEGRRMLAQSLLVYRSAGNAWGQAAALYGLALAQLAALKPLRAKARATAAVALWRQIGSPHWLAIGLDTLAEASRCAGDEPGARRASSEARALREKVQPTVFVR